MKLSYNPLRQLIEIQDWLGSTRITPDALGRAQKVQYRMEGKYPIPMEKQEREEALPIRMEKRSSMAMMSSSGFRN